MSNIDVKTDPACEAGHKENAKHELRPIIAFVALAVILIVGVLIGNSGTAHAATPVTTPVATVSAATPLAATPRPSNEPVSLHIRCGMNPDVYRLFQDSVRTNGQPTLTYGKDRLGDKAPKVKLFLSFHNNVDGLCIDLKSKPGDATIARAQLALKRIVNPEVTIENVTGPGLSTLTSDFFTLKDANGIRPMYVIKQGVYKDKFGNTVEFVDLTTRAPRK